jgi:nucleotide-binding universal stress UspA family protein
MSEKMKLLIGYDGSECADGALDDLRRAGLPLEAEVTVMSVTEVWLPPPPPSSYEIMEEASEVSTPADLKSVYVQDSKAVEEAKGLAERAQKRLIQNFPGWKVKAEGTYGSPAWELIVRADEWQPDLIVVGSHGRSALGRFVLGSVSQKVVTESRTSVRVARGRIEVEDSPVRIVIGVDGSESSDEAVRAVARRQWPLGSEARITIVDDPLTPTLMGRLIPPVARWIEESNEEERHWVHEVIEKATAALSATDLRVSSMVKEGDPKKLLVEAAEEWGADSIFVGSTGFGNRFERFLLGSVSAAVVARAHCTVEVVRARASVE